MMKKGFKMNLVNNQSEYMNSFVQEERERISTLRLPIGKSTANYSTTLVLGNSIDGIKGFSKESITSILNAAADAFKHNYAERGVFHNYDWKVQIFKFQKDVDNSTNDTIKAIFSNLLNKLKTLNIVTVEPAAPLDLTLMMGEQTFVLSRRLPAN